MLELQNISVMSDEKCILSNISTSLKSGQLVAICGPNGAGKSTLLSCMAKLQNYTGQIQFKQKSLAQWPIAELAKHRAWLAQQTDVSLEYSTNEILSLSGNEATPLLLDIFQLNRFLSQGYHQLSGGEQQRVQMLRSFLQFQTEPSMWLLDEPTASLDIGWQHKCLQFIHRWSRQGNLAVVVMHDLQLAAQYADYCLLLDNGKLLAQGSVDEIFTTERLSHLYQHPIQVLSNNGNINITATSRLD